MSDVEETSEADLMAEVEHAQWARDMAVEEAVNAAKPDHSPVCVEVATLKWRLDLLSNGTSDAYLASGLGFRFLYGVQKSGPRESPWRAWNVDWEITGETFHPTLEAAQAFCQADFERRTLELGNARSVESVKAERDRELIEIFAAKSQQIDQSDANGRALALSYINAVQCLRSLTEGEG